MLASVYGFAAEHFSDIFQGKALLAGFAVAGFVVVPSVFIFAVTEGKLFQFFFVGEGVPGDPYPRAANLNRDSVKVNQLFKDGLKLFGGFGGFGFGGVGFARCASVGVFESSKEGVIFGVDLLHIRGLAAFVGVVLEYQLLVFLLKLFQGGGVGKPFHFRVLLFGVVVGCVALCAIMIHHRSSVVKWFLKKFFEIFFGKLKNVEIPGFFGCKKFLGR